ncbi:MAG TPA: HD domain-containing protein [Candidatus Methanoculleus thermohydrogenotrophicum]|jgi:3'-5' exoribonuclease|nr:HD domain-containing protein [Candidatus Methanoculleus thermohydrogenotrophicum]HPZ38763.1 HD domain-containing protein [Candidatus Methanoculleus thermohydrogenotrophicum]HQC91935.1 HD domain-containing protein [Candidatus Methanoculleus thermohydrogenotrophicum]
MQQVILARSPGNKPPGFKGVGVDWFLTGDPVLAKTVFVKEISGGMQVDAPFVVDAAELREKRDGGKYIQLTISDRTGRGACKVWGKPDQNADQIEAFYRAIRVGEVYRILGYAKVFNGTCEVNVNDGIASLATPIPVDSVDPSLFVHSPVDRDSVREGLGRMAAKINDPGIYSLVSRLMYTTAGFLEAPAAKLKHHAYIGGLAEHTLETAEIALSLADAVSRMEIDTDVLLAGALLHDIGKASCFRRQGFSFVALPDYTLIGHTALGASALLQHSAGVDPSRFSHILHILMAHHGPYGEVRPRTPEAWAVHFADNASASLRGVCDDVADLAPGEERYQGARTGGPVYRF